jgi:hypothetical protein
MVTEHIAFPRLCFRLLLKYNVTINRLKSHYTRNLDPLDNIFFVCEGGWMDLFKIYFIKNPQLVTSLGIDIAWLNSSGMLGVKLFPCMLVNFFLLRSNYIVFKMWYLSQKKFH